MESPDYGVWTVKKRGVVFIFKCIKKNGGVVVVPGPGGVCV